MIKNSGGNCVFQSYFLYNIQKRTFFDYDQFDTEDRFDRYSREYYLSIIVNGNGENSIMEMIEKDRNIPDYFKKQILEDVDKKWESLISLFDKNTGIHP